MLEGVRSMEGLGLMPQDAMFSFATWIVPARAMECNFSGDVLSDPETIFGQRADRSTIEVHGFQPLPTNTRPNWTLRATLPVGQACHEKAEFRRKQETPPRLAAPKGSVDSYFHERGEPRLRQSASVLDPWRSRTEDLRSMGPNVRHERWTKGREAAFGTSARWRG